MFSLSDEFLNRINELEKNQISLAGKVERLEAKVKEFEDKNDEGKNMTDPVKSMTDKEYEESYKRAGERDRAPRITITADKDHEELLKRIAELEKNQKRLESWIDSTSGLLQKLSGLLLEAVKSCVDIRKAQFRGGVVVFIAFGFFAYWMFMRATVSII